MVTPAASQAARSEKSSPGAAATSVAAAVISRSRVSLSRFSCTVLHYVL